MTSEFETLSESDHLIVMKDIETGHVFTMPVIVNEFGQRILGRGTFVAHRMATVRPEDIAGRVWNYAQMQMEMADRVGRIFTARAPRRS